MTEPHDPTTTDRRLLELAHDAALAHHFAAFDDYSTNAHRAHDHDFGACPHPDCALVRRGVARDAPPWPGLMAGFTPPAVPDRTTTNSGDVGGPSFDTTPRAAGARLGLKEIPMTNTDTAPIADATTNTAGADTTTITRCACGVPLGTAHYCAARDHNWVKAPEPADDAD
jgi:hypothetical protein